MPRAHEAYEKVLTAFDNQQTITPDELSALNTKQFIWSPSIGRVEIAPDELKRFTTHLVDKDAFSKDYEKYWDNVSTHCAGS